MFQRGDAIRIIVTRAGYPFGYPSEDERFQLEARTLFSNEIGVSVVATGDFIFANGPHDAEHLSVSAVQAVFIPWSQVCSVQLKLESKRYNEDWALYYTLEELRYEATGDEGGLGYGEMRKWFSTQDSPELQRKAGVVLRRQLQLLEQEDSRGYQPANREVRAILDAGVEEPSGEN